MIALSKLLQNDHSVNPVLALFRRPPFLRLAVQPSWRIALLPLLVWLVVSHGELVDEAFLPSPARVIDSLWSMARSGILWADASASMYRVMLGFFLAAVVGAPLGILMGSLTTVRALLEPLSGFLRYMPAVAFTPLLIIYLGIDEAPKIALIAIGTVFFNMLMVIDAVKFVPRDLIETTLTLGGSQRQIVSQVITHYTMPSIIDTLRINMATSWNLLVVAELMAAEVVGLGKRIQLAQRFFRAEQIFADLLVLGLIGFALDLAFQLLLRLTCRWPV